MNSIQFTTEVQAIAQAYRTLQSDTTNKLFDLDVEAMNNGWYINDYEYTQRKRIIERDMSDEYSYIQDQVSALKEAFKTHKDTFMQEGYLGFCQVHLDQLEYLTTERT